MKALDTFFSVLQTEPDRAYYGYVIPAECIVSCGNTLVVI